jgi:ubiquinone biosynthesis UbiH/UbiF/VisC/COQ6 family hydroxylase
MKKDIIIIGAGPSGLSFAASLANSGLNLLVVERSLKSDLQLPSYDGREIAITLPSVNILKQLNVWSRIDEQLISPIKAAKVLDGNSSYSLDFSDGQNTLGYLVSNHLIRKALYEEVSNLNNVEIIADTSVENIKNDGGHISVFLSNKETIEAPLVVATDSRFSEARRKMGIPANMHDFARTMILCKIEHEKPHDNVAFEYFDYDRVIALLPMSGNASSLVITVPASTANQVINMNEQQFLLDITNRFGNELGKISLASKRFSYPLVAVYSNKFVADRFALVGDAAVGMHPVTAHGFNLSLHGQDILAKKIKLALMQGGDIGARKVLEKYQSEHTKATKTLYLGTNLIINLFTNNHTLSKLFRKVTLRIANNKFLPFKRMIINRLTGRSNRFPSLQSKSYL